MLKQYFPHIQKVHFSDYFGSSSRKQVLTELPFDEVASTIYQVVPIPKASLWEVLRIVKEFWLYQATIPEYT